ncbi:MAG: SH3 domain-containing protein [Thiolinea sp.]
MYSKQMMFPLSMAWPLLLLIPLVLLPFTAQAELSLIAMDGQKIVTGSTVRMRAQPSLTADVVGHLSLGAVVRATQRSKDKLQTGAINHYWYFVQANNLKGWVSGSLLRDFKPEQKEQIWFEIIKSRLDDKELSFPDRVALYKFVSLVVQNAQSEKLKGAFELGQLLALQKSFDQLNYDSVNHEPQAGWIKGHQQAGRVFHDEVSGQWLVPATDYWKLADKHKGGPAGDEIAWYAANAQLGGECEGDIACNLEREKITQGEYLRRYPLGRYANVSLQRLTETLEYIHDALKQEPDYFRHAPESGEVINTLLEIIRSSNPKLSEYPGAVENIKAIRMVFDKAGG